MKNFKYSSLKILKKFSMSIWYCIAYHTYHVSSRNTIAFILARPIDSSIYSRVGSSFSLALIPLAYSEPAFLLSNQGCEQRSCHLWSLWCSYFSSAQNLACNCLLPLTCLNLLSSLESLQSGCLGVGLLKSSTD